MCATFRYVPDKDGELPLHKRIILCALDRFYDTLTNFSSRQEQFRRAIEEQVWLSSCRNVSRAKLTLVCIAVTRWHMGSSHGTKGM